MAWRIWQTIVKGVRSLSRVEKGWHSPQKSSESCLTIQAYARLVYANLFSSSLHTHTHGKGGDVNPARLPKFNAPLVFGRRVSATARASADAALAPRIRFLLLYFSLDRFYPPRSPIPSCLLVSWRAVLVQPGPGFARSFTSDWLAILSHLSARVLLFLVTVCHVRGDISPSPRFIAKLPLSLSVASLESFFTVR